MYISVMTKSIAYFYLLDFLKKRWAYTVTLSSTMVLAKAEKFSKSNNYKIMKDIQLRKVEGLFDKWKKLTILEQGDR